MGQAQTSRASWGVVATGPAGDAVHPLAELITEVVARDNIYLDAEVERYARDALGAPGPSETTPSFPPSLRSSCGLTPQKNSRP